MPQTEYLRANNIQGLLEASLNGSEWTESFQLVGGDLRLGGAVGAEGKKLAPIMGNVLDLSSGAAAISTKPIVGGVIGAYSITNAHSSTYPVGAVLAQISDGVDDDAVHGFLAYCDGDSGATTQAGAAFKVMHNNSLAGNGFAYGLDLYDAAHDGYQALAFRTADIRLNSGGLIVSVTTAITANSTTTTLAAGTLGKTTHATGRASLFVSDGSKWQFLTNS